MSIIKSGIKFLGNAFDKYAINGGAMPATMQMGTMSPAIDFYKDTGKQLLFAPNSRVSQQVDRGFVYREMYIRLTGALTVAAASNIPANMFAGDEWALISDIIIRLNGRDILKRFSGASLRWMNYYWYGGFPIKNASQLGAGGLNPTFDSFLIIPFWMPKSVRPMDFALDTRNLSRVDIEVAFGNFANINSTATGFTVPPVVQIYLHEITNVQGQFSRWNIFPLTFSPAAAQQRFQMPIPVGYMYRSFLINDPSAILNGNIYLESGPTQWTNIPALLVNSVIGVNRRGSQVYEISVTGNNFRSGAPSDNFFNWPYYDHPSDGFNAESIDTFGLSEFYMYADVSGPGSLTIYPSQLVVPRG